MKLCYDMNDMLLFDVFSITEKRNKKKYSFVQSIIIGLHDTESGNK